MEAVSRELCCLRLKLERKIFKQSLKNFLLFKKNFQQAEKFF
jgi:hypothetical protein